MRMVNEIFSSLQGEGALTGTPAVFVRFSGCNLRCAFCDTRHNDGAPMTDQQIIDQVNAYPLPRLVVLTGGEPSLWIDESFVAKLKSMTGKRVAIETNGTRPVPPSVDWITLSPKTGMEGGDLESLTLTACDELKVVYLGQSLEQYATIQTQHRFLQPCYCHDPDRRRQNEQATVAAVMAHPQWRLSLQTHRILGIR